MVARRLLVTGGAGFIGSTFVRRRLAATTDHITVVDKLTYAGSLGTIQPVMDDPATAARVRFVQGDIADADLVRELVADCDAVINFAAESHVDRSILDATAFLRTGVLGVHALLEAVRLADETRGDRGRVRYLQVSTDEVYGPVMSGQSLETDTVRPRSPYSAAKAAGELLVQAYHLTHGLDTLITRGANTYGPYQHPEKLIPLFITNALQDLPLPMYGDGSQRRDWMFVDDHADGIAFVLDQGAGGGTYNVAGHEERSNREVTATVLAAVSKDWSLVRSVPDRPAHDVRYAMDPARLTEMGWLPRVTFDDGIARTVAWYQAHTPWWQAHRGGDWAAYYEQQYGWRLQQSTEA